MSAAKRYVWNKNFPNGDRYNGEAVGDNIKDGNGEYFWAANSATYKGEWSNDVPQGKGTMTVPGVDGFTYTGHFLKGKRDGKGTCRFENGREYTGEWKEDQMSGEGTLKGAANADDFVEYVGGFAGGYRSGPRGTCRYKDGSTYTGSWEHGRRQGQGELTLVATGGNPSAPVKYIGPFHANEPSTVEGRAAAEIQYADGSVYHGGVDQLQREGEGELRQANGDVFKGMFSRNAKQGAGVLKCANGKVYEGAWRNDRMEGNVTYRNSEAAHTAAPADREKTVVTYSGPCVLDQFTGVGAKVSYADGSTYQGEVREGLPVNQGVLENRTMTGLPTALFGPEMVLKHYEGNFFAGKPEGQGTGQLQAPTTMAGGAAATTGFFSQQDGVPPGAKGLILSYGRNGTFSGQWSQGVPNGKGTWRWDSGDVYDGPVVQGVPHGEGRFKSAQEQYEGGFVQGQPDGKGRYEHLLLKERYDGGWAKGLFHGEGQWSAERTRDRDEAEQYKGSWSHGRKEGKGVETCGTVQYDGEFRNGKWEGKGRWADSDSGTQYEGAFSNGTLTGAGVMKLPKGTTVDGHFDNGLPEGNATVTFASQGIEKFTGHYKQGQVTGTGEITYMNGDHYKGEVEPSMDDNEELPGLTPQRHGKGVFTFVEGNQLECTWRHNVLHGEGKYRAAGSDEVTTRQYVDGVLATHAAKAEDVFSPENMFPNTQSEEALKEKMQTVKKPFKFVKRGESRQAANAGGSEATATNNTNTNTYTNNNNTSIGTTKVNNGSKGPATATSPSARRTSKPPQTETSNPISSRRTSKLTTETRPAAAAAAPSGSAGPRRTSNAVVPTRSTQPLKRPSIPPSKKPANARVAATSNGRVSASPSASLSPPQVKRRTEETRATTSADLINRFQNGIAVMEEKNKTASATADLTYTNDSTRQETAPLAPLQGSLKELMDQACAIRSSSEDEIHLLTEELRQMNERIWQLKFSLQGEKNKKKQDVLRGLQRDRLSTVEKLQYLLQSI